MHRTSVNSTIGRSLVYIQPLIRLKEYIEYRGNTSTLLSPKSAPDQGVDFAVIQAVTQAVSRITKHLLTDSFFLLSFLGKCSMFPDTRVYRFYENNWDEIFLRHSLPSFLSYHTSVPFIAMGGRQNKMGMLFSQGMVLVVFFPNTQVNQS